MPSAKCQFSHTKVCWNESHDKCHFIVPNTVIFCLYPRSAIPNLSVAVFNKKAVIGWERSEYKYRKCRKPYGPCWFNLHLVPMSEVSEHEVNFLDNIITKWNAAILRISFNYSRPGCARAQDHIPVLQQRSHAVTSPLTNNDRAAWKWNVKIPLNATMDDVVITSCVASKQPHFTSSFIFVHYIRFATFLHMIGSPNGKIAKLIVVSRSVCLEGWSIFLRCKIEIKMTIQFNAQTFVNWCVIINACLCSPQANTDCITGWNHICMAYYRYHLCVPLKCIFVLTEALCWWVVSFVMR